MVSKKDIMMAIHHNVVNGMYSDGKRVNLDKVRRACELNNISFDEFLKFESEE